MKSLPYFLSFLLVAGSLAAQDEPAAEAPASGIPQIEVSITTPEAKAAQEKFLKLPAEQQEKFGKLMAEGEKLLSERRVPEALQRLTDAEALWPEHPNLLNLKGACLVNIRDFERALPYFEKAAKLYPEFWQSHFNRAEMFFVQKKWEEAEKLFRDLLKHEQEVDAATRKLVDYKIMLCLIKRQKFDEATALINKYDIYDEAPIHYYALAALHFEKGERKQAEEWVTNARAVYEQQVNAIYEDSLTELGWLFVF